MEDYKNLNGNSGVVRYQIGHDYIIVQFDSGKERFYKYSYISTGPDKIEQMKFLAEQGCGLSSYIKKEVGEYFEEKW